MIRFDNWTGFTVWRESGPLEGAFFRLPDGEWERRNFQAFSKYGMLSVGADDIEAESQHNRIWQLKIAEIRKLKAKHQE